MLSNVLQNLLSFVSSTSMLTNLIVLSIILLIMHFIAKVKIKECISIAIGYILIMFLCACFGLYLPGLLDIGKWIVSAIKGVIDSVW